MKLCVFCFFDNDGNVYDYVPAYLREIKKEFDIIDVVVNGELNEEGREKLTENVRHIYIRENVGYDAGAYAEYFNVLADKEEIKSCEKIALINDTVFGPLVPIESIFSKMAGRYDFWGIMEQDRRAFRYLISFFLVFEKRILSDGVLFDYFTKYDQELRKGDYNNTLALFERCLSPYLRQRGYSCGSYCNIPHYDIFYSADHCIIKGGLPVLKKKVVNTDMHGKMQLDMILEHVRDHSEYDEKLIIQYINRSKKLPYTISEYSKGDKEYKLDHIAFVNQFDTSEEEIIEFIGRHQKLYIFGAGLLGKTIYYAYNYYLKDMKGFVVSKPPHDHTDFLGYAVMGLQDVPDDAGIIVALDRFNTDEVRDRFMNKNKDVLFLWMS